MYISKHGINFIKSFEGFKSKSYICPAGYKTIGYGHVVRDHEDLEDVTESQALDLLHKDIEKSEYAVNKLTHVALSQNQFDMLVSFAFNLGGGAYQRSTLRSKVNREEHELVPYEFKRWIYSNGKILPGLVARRKMEGDIYSS